MLLVPALKLLPKSSKGNELLIEAAEQSILADNYEAMQESRQQKGDVDRVAQGLIKSTAANDDATKQIKEKVVSKDEIPVLA